MTSLLRTGIIAILSSALPLFAGERRIVDGYAVQISGGVLFSLRPTSSPLLALAAAPLDRHFVPPSRVRWEVELSGVLDSQGLPVARALRSAPDDYSWPAGEELSPERFAGASNALNPFENPLDPLGVAPGGPPDYDQDGAADEDDAFPGDPAEAVDTDRDGTGNNADPDDDDDGMPDLWEIAGGLNPLFANGGQDSDFDGTSNFEEYEADTLPLNGSSRLRVAIIFPTPGTLRLSWTGMPGRTYSLWRLPALSLHPVLITEGLGVGSLPDLLSPEFPANAPSDFYFLKASLAPGP